MENTGIINTENIVIVENSVILVNGSVSVLKKLNLGEDAKLIAFIPENTTTSIPDVIINGDFTVESMTVYGTLMSTGEISYING